MEFECIKVEEKITKKRNKSGQVEIGPTKFVLKMTCAADRKLKLTLVTENSGAVGDKFELKDKSA